MLTFYKPNKSNRGSLVNFKLAAGKGDKAEYKEGCVFVTMVKQTGWNEKLRTGSFKDGESISVKLGLIELGEMINVINKTVRFNAYHSSASGGTTINFSPWEDKETKEHTGFGLQVIREKEGEKTNFAIGFKMGEGVVLSEFFRVAIEHILLANYAEEKRRAKDYANSKQNRKTDEPLAGNPDPAMIDEVEALFG